MDLCSDLLQCFDLDPEMRSRCALDVDHVGAHENWYGTWYGGVWITRGIEVAR
jgi:hypothetical protein